MTSEELINIKDYFNVMYDDYGRLYCIQNIVYESITKASKECNICISSISNCLRGRITTAGGYHWEYKI